MASTIGKSPLDQSAGKTNEDSHVEPQPKRRAQRATRACDFCHSRSIRCRQADDSSDRCQSCIEYGRECTYHRPAKKRGLKRRQDASLSAGDLSSPIDFESKPATSTILEGFSRQLVMCVANIYTTVIHPSFPLFHLPTFYSRINQGEQLRDAAFGAAFLSMCALVSVRIRDGPSLASAWSAQDIQSLPSTEEIVDAGLSTMPQDADGAEQFEFIRATCLLSLVAIQNGKIRELRYTMGLYRMLANVNGLMNEDLWPTELSAIEIEERRRVTWAMFRLEVFSVLCFDHSSIAIPELPSKVLYPQKLHDDMLSKEVLKNAKGWTNWQTSASQKSKDVTHVNWVRGWSFVTDVYYVLRVVVLQRFATTDQPRRLPLDWMADLVRRKYVEMRPNILSSYQYLSQQLQEIRSGMLDSSKDQYHFPAIDLAFNFQLLRTTQVLDNSPSDADCVLLMEELMSIISVVTLAYITDMGALMIYQTLQMCTMICDSLEQNKSALFSGPAAMIISRMSNFLSKFGTGVPVTDELICRIRACVRRMESLKVPQRNFNLDEANYVPTQYSGPEPPSTLVFWPQEDDSPDHFTPSDNLADGIVGQFARF